MKCQGSCLSEVPKAEKVRIRLKRVRLAFDLCKLRLVWWTCTVYFWRADKRDSTRVQLCFCIGVRTDDGKHSIEINQNDGLVLCTFGVQTMSHEILQLVFFASSPLKLTRMQMKENSSLVFSQYHYIISRYCNTLPATQFNSATFVLPLLARSRSTNQVEVRYDQRHQPWVIDCDCFPGGLNTHVTFLYIFVLSWCWGRKCICFLIAGGWISN